MVFDVQNLPFRMIGIVSFARRRGFAAGLAGLLLGFGSHLAAVSELSKYSSSVCWSIGLIINRL
jgi:hypothetical protein|tara:strand:- start:338 stop:529 length:192 start_codon:yes stop_codon:yes gene_type:complete